MAATAKLATVRSTTYQPLIAQLLSIFAAVVATAAGARLEIMHDPVPYTLQTLMVLLAGAFLGARNGAISQMVYLGAGLLGAPVFAGGAFGAMKLFGPTGGYLLAFPAAAALTGYLIQYRRSLLWAFVSMAAGLLVIFASGTIHLYAFTFHSWGTAFTSGFLIFSWWDLIKLSAGAMIYHEVAKRWPKLPA